MKFLDDYKAFTGLEANNNKSCFVTGQSNDDRDTMIRTITKFQKRNLPLTYLGCPLYTGRTSPLIFYSLQEKIQAKLAGWKGKLLSAGAKIVLIKNVLQAMPLYLFPIIEPPKSVIKTLSKICSDFFWNNTDRSHRIHWVSWKRMCLPSEEGGLGFRHF